MSEEKPDQDRDPADIQHTAEDVFGFNFRSLKTLRDLALRPRDVFAAYARGDREAYTPAPRLWLGLVGVIFLVSILWGGFDGIVSRQFDTMPPESIAALENQLGYSFEIYSARFGEAAQFLYVPCLALMTGLVAFIPGLIGRGLTWHARIHITFAILSFASLFGILLMPVQVFFPQYGLIPILIVFAIYVVEHLRGSPGLPTYDGRRRYLRAVGFGVVTVTMTMLGGAIMGIGATIYAMWPAFTGNTP